MQFTSRRYAGKHICHESILCDHHYGKDSIVRKIIQEYYKLSLVGGAETSAAGAGAGNDEPGAEQAGEQGAAAGRGGGRQPFHARRQRQPHRLTQHQRRERGRRLPGRAERQQQPHPQEGAVRDAAEARAQRQLHPLARRQHR
jgi:hypothetical protein